MNRLDWKRQIGKWVGGFTENEQRTVILIYHSVGNGPLAVSENMFREQVAWLAERATIVSLTSALERRLATRTQVVITFDDGYASVHDRAAPILMEHDAPATVFLNTGWIGDLARNPSNANLGHYPNEYFMKWGEVQSLANAGWTLGSHGVDHLDLTHQVQPTVERELVNSKHEIENRLCKPCQYFAYTWGRYSPSLQSSVRVAGYECAMSGLHGPLATDSDRFAIPRIDIRAEYAMADFADVVSGRWDYLGFKHRLARRLA